MTARKRGRLRAVEAERPQPVTLHGEDGPLYFYPDDEPDRAAAVFLTSAGLMSKLTGAKLTRIAARSDAFVKAHRRSQPKVQASIDCAVLLEEYLQLFKHARSVIETQKRELDALKAQLAERRTKPQPTKKKRGTRAS